MVPDLSSGARRLAALAAALGLLVATAQAQKSADPGAGMPNDDLSDKLEKSEGVIQPRNPDIDREISKPPPPSGHETMPVIPPPGSPGGDPSVRPK